VALLQASGVQEQVMKGHGNAKLIQDPIAEPVVDVRAAAAEFVAMTLFVIIGIGSAMGVATAKPEGGWVNQVSLTFGLAISALAYSIGHISGGQINCAVTLGLVVTGNLSAAQGAVNFLAQLVGAILGALILSLMHTEETDATKGLGCNAAPEGGKMRALVGEIMMTALLVFVVLETAINPATVADRQVACLAIGFAVFLAHTVLIPIDGCSINPTRSLGPALVRKYTYKKDAGSLADMWIFWVGPLTGALLGAGVYTALLA
jgi:MIP family channel proteins